jgi:hypothetical protein
MKESLRLRKRRDRLREWGFFDDPKERLWFVSAIIFILEFINYLEYGYYPTYD